MGHKASECQSKNRAQLSTDRQSNSTEFTSLLTAEAHSVISDEHNLKWCLDSGATSHFSNNINDFVTVAEHINDRLNLDSNGSSKKVTARGTATFTANIYGNKDNIILKNTLHITELRTNLLSVGRIADNGYSVLF